ncbi:hypothetical protein [Vibrio phage vB_VmeM-Yong XC32]|nr:hypothetical protein [Vibrio phage vB_VmeM-Yong XC31]QAX96577.1 hypothetical protein [Vibrio phage vB_VmeM-Yong XC32]QAX96895.1 hypothetical protein [Vibrio phage vB_VmeM-Yong MS31]QAX97200.1 hypothetical protein [Vibrio phage vB_VmeM-Yong MS32]
MYLKHLKGINPSFLHSRISESGKVYDEKELVAKLEAHRIKVDIPSLVKDYVKLSKEIIKFKAFMLERYNDNFCEDCVETLQVLMCRPEIAIYGMEYIRSEYNSIFAEAEDIIMEAEVLYIADTLSGEAEEVLEQMAKGPLFDGNAVSKCGKSELYGHELCVRIVVNGEHGDNALNLKGYRVWKELKSREKGGSEEGTEKMKVVRFELDVPAGEMVGRIEKIGDFPISVVQVDVPTKDAIARIPVTFERRTSCSVLTEDCHLSWNLSSGKAGRALSRIALMANSVGDADSVLKVDVLTCKSDLPFEANQIMGRTFSLKNLYSNHYRASACPDTTRIEGAMAKNLATDEWEEFDVIKRSQVSNDCEYVVDMPEKGYGSPLVVFLTDNRTETIQAG